MRDDPEVQEVVRRYQLGRPRLLTSGSGGDLLGRATGNSLEFHEYREYQLGDDLRHLDWAAFGRTDELLVRLFRDEVSPACEIVLDLSRSMTSGNGTKAQLARRLAASLSLISARSGSRPRIYPVGDQRPVREFGVDQLLELATLSFDGLGNLADSDCLSGFSGRPRSVRILISDFLFPLDPESLVKQFARGVSNLWVIQLLTEWESTPTPVGGCHLVDIETADEWDLVIDGSAVERYQRRLAMLQESMRRACQKVRGEFISCISDPGLEQVCCRDLVPAGLLRTT